jgi:hypothetical protein
VQFIDMEALAGIAAGSWRDHRGSLAGQSWYRSALTLAYVKAESKAAKADAICNAFVTGARRTFDQDPRLSLITMSEVASRALVAGRQRSRYGHRGPVAPCSHLHKLAQGGQRSGAVLCERARADHFDGRHVR